MNKKICLRDLRKIRGLSQGALAAKLGVVPCTVSAWELGRAKPKPKAMRKLKQVLKFGGEIIPQTTTVAVSVKDIPNVNKVWSSKLIQLANKANARMEARALAAMKYFPEALKLHLQRA